MLKSYDVFMKDLANQVPPIDRWRFGYGFKYPILRWQRRLRRIEELETSSNSIPFKILLLALRWIHKKDSIRLGFTIPPHTFGPGLSIAHWGTIAVEGKVRVGSNCRIHQGVTIGRAKGKFPTIGDDCFIGANATIIGGLTLGNYVKVGAGAVVLNSFSDGAVLVGVPALNVKLHSQGVSPASNK